MRTSPTARNFSFRYLYIMYIADILYVILFRENFLLQSQLCVLTLYSVSVPPQCYRSGMLKTPVILPKVQVAGYTWTHIGPWPNEVGVGWLYCYPGIVWEPIRKRAHTQLVREHSVTVISSSLSHFGLILATSEINVRELIWPNKCARANLNCKKKQKKTHRRGMNCRTFSPNPRTRGKSQQEQQAIYLLVNLPWSHACVTAMFFTTNIWPLLWPWPVSANVKQPCRDTVILNRPPTEPCNPMNHPLGISANEKKEEKSWVFRQHCWSKEDRLLIQTLHYKYVHL